MESDAQPDGIGMLGGALRDVGMGEVKGSATGFGLSEVLTSTLCEGLMLKFVIRLRAAGLR